MFAGLIGAGAAAAAGPVELAREMPARILAAHNQVRADASVAPRVWDSALGEAAANDAV